MTQHDIFLYYKALYTCLLSVILDHLVSYKPIINPRDYKLEKPSN